MIISCLVLQSKFSPGQGTRQRPFCLANPLGIAKQNDDSSLALNRIRIPDSTNSPVNVLKIKLTVTCDNFVASQRPFCLTNSLRIAPKVPLANKTITAVSLYVFILTIKLTVNCDNFVASLTKVVSSWPRNSSETSLLGKLVGHRA